MERREARLRNCRIFRSLSGVPLAAHFVMSTGREDKLAIQVEDAEKVGRGSAAPPWPSLTFSTPCAGLRAPGQRCQDQAGANYGAEAYARVRGRGRPRAEVHAWSQIKPRCCSLLAATISGDAVLPPALYDAFGDSVPDQDAAGAT